MSKICYLSRNRRLETTRHVDGRSPAAGYVVKDRKLVINENEAETVRHIYTFYLELKSVQLLAPYRKQLRVGDSERHKSSHRTETIDIKVTGQFIRCGKQVRLVLGNDTDDQPKPDQRLIEEVVRARQWFDDIASGRAASIAKLAKRDKHSAPYISRKISLVFLAPDIIESIINGSQPKSLTPEKLKKVCPLLLSWDEQRAIFLASHQLHIEGALAAPDLLARRVRAPVGMTFAARPLPQPN